MRAYHVLIVLMLSMAINAKAGSLVRTADIDTLLPAVQLLCGESSGGLYGEEGQSLFGYSLAPNANGDGYYVAGHRDGELLLMSFSLGGTLNWSRSMDVVPNVDDHPISIITDSDGMIGIAGMGAANPHFGGSAFVLRFDPATQAVLWAIELKASDERDRVHGFSQNGPGGNYLLLSNSVEANNDDFQLTEINIGDGTLTTGVTRNFHLGASETIWELIHHEGNLYGIGRYTVSGSPGGMRNALVKMNAANLDPVWTRLGHRTANQTARLYGYDLVIDQGFIYAGYYGDADGTSTTMTEMYLQKTTLDGEVVWVKEYNLPTSTDWGYEIVKSGDGFVVFAVNRNTVGSLFLYKIDADGNLLWSKEYDIDGNVNTETVNIGSSQLIALQDKLVFTATVSMNNGQISALVVETDESGEPALPCVVAAPVSMEVSTVENTVFFEIDAAESNVQRAWAALSSAVSQPVVKAMAECALPDSITIEINASICQGQEFEGYTKSGTYEDDFTTTTGCDSTRILHLTVVNCGCGSLVTGIYGTEQMIERGYSLSPTAEGDGYYVCGIREDSVLIMKRNLQGLIEWIVTLDVNPKRMDHPVSIITDTEGMIGIAGMSSEVLYAGGEPFALRFNPYSRQLLWLRQFDTPLSRDRVHSLFQHPGVAGGQYLMSSNPVNDAVSNDDFLITVINAQNGATVSGSSHRFDYRSADFMLDFVFEGGALYAAGRYTDGEQPAQMRHTLTKMDPDDFTPEWTRLGHIPKETDARLYGFDLVIDNGFIYSGYYGDEDGVSVTNTNLWIQKTTLDGELVWLKQYDTPGNRDLGYEILKQGNGFVVMAVTNRGPGAFYLFKIDREGNLLWANSYQFESSVNTFVELFGASQLINVGGQLVFTGYTEEPDGDENMLVVQADSIGRFEAPCIERATIDIPVTDVTNPVFYTIIPDKSDFVMPGELISPDAVQTMIPAFAACAVIDTVVTTVEATICEGDAYEGYTMTGVYEDLFVTAEGCDSLRVLFLFVSDCCGQKIATVYGEPGITELGLSISRTRDNDGYFLAGTRSDSVLIMRFTSNDELVWSHIMDAIPGKPEYPVALITDSDGMLGLAGMATDDPAEGGNPFLLRFNPVTQTLLWSQEIESTFDLDRVHGLAQNGPGGNYLLSTNPLEGTTYNDFQLMEFDPQTGAAITGVAKNFHLGNSNYMFDMVRHGDFLYASGRYSLGVGLDLLRNTLTKLDANTFAEVWTRVGHVDATLDQRVYGYDMLVDNNFIYSGIYGDPDGTSVTETKTFVQKTTLDGELVWLKEYDLPTNTDFGWDVVRSGDGYVFLVNDRNTNGELYLYKVDSEGAVMWARHYETDLTVNTVSFNIGGDQLIALGNDLVFTASVVDAGGGQDILVIHTDGEGFTDAPCVTVETIALQAVDVTNPNFHEVAVVESDTMFIQTAFHPVSNMTEVPSIVACEGINVNDTLIEATICTGEDFLGYTATGVYTDTFELPDGCDSIRIIQLTVLACEPVVYYDLDACRSYMADGSIMDYSEFVAEHPSPLSCGDVDATILFRDPPAENKHSCTEGLNGTVAMCISALATCTYMPGHDASAVFEVTFTPAEDSVIAFNKLEFYEKAPANYAWIDGPTGPNNYPRFYGIRILRNGVQVFEQHDISTSLTWALQSYSFNDIPEFTMDGPATFRIELLPYCPVNNGALVSAWDLEDIRVLASCVPVVDNGLVIGGTVRTAKEFPLAAVGMTLSHTTEFDLPAHTESGNSGYYLFEALERGRGYHVKAENNTGLLQGISTLDLIALQKHLLGKRPLVTLDQCIAADINRDGKVNAMDMINLRKALLGMVDEFPGNTSWRFAVKPLALNSTDMHSFTERAYIESLVAHTTLDWLGVKVGDINGDRESDLADGDIASRSFTTYPLTLLQLSGALGTGSMIDVIAGEPVDVEGMQLALNLHGTHADVIAGAINLTNEHYAVDEAGVLRISWNSPEMQSIAAGTRLFSIRLLSNSYVPITLDENSIASEVYAADEVRPVALKHVRQGVEVETEVQMVISPNPFSNQFAINFEMPQAGHARLEIFNALGATLYSEQMELAAGSHQHVITRAMIGGRQSMVACRLMTNDETITRIVIQQ